LGVLLLLTLPQTGFAMRPAGTPATTPPPRPAAQKSYTYVFPVRPLSATQYGAYHHDYPATDIFCPVGSRFVAPISGVVQYVSRVDTWDPKTDDPAVRGGLSVAIIGDDRVRYYGSHLSAIAAGIAPGVRVKVGQLLGLTGHSGDARYTAPHLHFGISHPTAPNDWKSRRGEVSPYKYLKSWAAGKNLTPTLPATP
jgi:murein DD-endopeptidase MepM/ murein hydrolase activator NlpD